MDRWSGVMKVPLHPYSRARYQVAASLCLNSSSTSLGVPSTNAIFFGGDRVQGTGNRVIEKLSDLKTVADILVSKLGHSINAWVIEASNFNGPFAVYKDFIPSVTQRGEPKSYDAAGFSASMSIALLLSNCLKEARNLISDKLQEPYQDEECLCPPRTILFGFSKGGTVLNQLMTELAFSELSSVKTHTQVNKPLISEELVNRQNTITPISQDILLDSIAEIHFVDVGLNTAGAYLTDPNVIKRISERALQRGSRIRFVLHGTPRQWCDPMRVWVREEKDALFKLLQSEAESSGGYLSVRERLYFADMPPNLQMHFEVIESMDLSQ